MQTFVRIRFLEEVADFINFRTKSTPLLKRIIPSIERVFLLNAHPSYIPLTWNTGISIVSTPRADSERGAWQSWTTYRHKSFVEHTIKSGRLSREGLIRNLSKLGSTIDRHAQKIRDYFDRRRYFRGILSNVRAEWARWNASRKYYRNTPPAVSLRRGDRSIETRVLRESIDPNNRVRAIFKRVFFSPSLKIHRVHAKTFQIFMFLRAGKLVGFSSAGGIQKVFGTERYFNATLLARTDESRRAGK